MIGTAPHADAQALERDRPLHADQTALEAYGVAVWRVIRAFQGAVTLPLLALAALGLWVARPWTIRARIWLFAGIIIALSALGLVRLHVTGGYCTVRHALIPAMLLRLAAAHGIAWLTCSIVIDGRWLGQPGGRFRPGPAVWAAALAGLLGYPFFQVATQVPGSFSNYRDAGSWLAQVTSRAPGKILDMTDWSLFFSQRPGFNLRDVEWGALDPDTRWVVARRAHLQGRWRYTRLVQGLIGGREPVVVFPHHPLPGQLQIRIFDRWAAPEKPAGAVAGGAGDAKRLERR
jgi:hypothetical protein